MTRVEDRLRELLHEAAAPSAPAVSFEKVARRARRRRAVRAAAFAGAVAAVAAAAVIAAGTVTFGPGSRVTGSGPPSAGPARHTGGIPNPIGWNGNLYPLGPPGSAMAEKTTVAGARAKVGYPVPVPSTPAASRANLTQVWVAPHNGRQAALVFDRGKVDILMQPATYQRALRYFRAFVKERRQNGAAAATIGQVNGRPALIVIWPGTNANHSQRTVVHFWRNGVLISIYSNTYGTDTLLAIAGSTR